MQKNLQRLLGGSSSIFLIVDECHRIGAPSYSEICEKEFSISLGLSATPDVEGRPEYNSRIRDLFLGGTLDKYTLIDALNDGHLCPFEYNVHTIQLTPKEQQKIRQFTKQNEKSFCYAKEGRATI